MHWQGSSIHSLSWFLYSYCWWCDAHPRNLKQGCFLTKDLPHYGSSTPSDLSYVSGTQASWLLSRHWPSFQAGSCCPPEAKRKASSGPYGTWQSLSPYQSPSKNRRSETHFKHTNNHIKHSSLYSANANHRSHRVAPTLLATMATIAWTRSCCIKLQVLEVVMLLKCNATRFIPKLAQISFVVMTMTSSPKKASTSSSSIWILLILTSTAFMESLITERSRKAMIPVKAGKTAPSWAITDATLLATSTSIYDTTTASSMSIALSMLFAVIWKHRNPESASSINMSTLNHHYRQHPPLNGGLSSRWQWLLMKF